MVAEDRNVLAVGREAKEMLGRNANRGNRYSTN